MDYITTTELRTKTSQLVKSLKNGKSVDLVHRSKVVGVFKPAQKKAVAITDIKAFKKALDAIKPKKILPRRERERVYREYMIKRHGKNLL